MEVNMEQTCKFCGSTWNVATDITKKIENCPFCGENIVEEMTIVTFLKAQIDEHGYRVLENASRINGMLADFFPKLDRERSTIRKAFEFGAGKVFFKIANNRQCNANATISAFRKRLSDEAWLADPAIDFICEVFLEAIDYDSIHFTSGDVNNQICESDVNSYNNSANEMDICRRVNSHKQVERRIETSTENSREKQISAEEYLELAEECKDDGKRAKYYGKAACLGNEIAMNRLGHMYEHGEGIVADIHSAIKLYEMAVQRGNRGAQHNLGFLYYTGNGVQKDFDRAFSLFYAAALQDNSGSQNNLGVMYEYGANFGQTVCPFRVSGTGKSHQRCAIPSVLTDTTY